MTPSASAAEGRQTHGSRSHGNCQATGAPANRKWDCAAKRSSVPPPPQESLRVTGGGAERESCKPLGANREETGAIRRRPPAQPEERGTLDPGVEETSENSPARKT
ncbi:uncharacterized protein LOC112674967 isoform X2 [Canis lupus dingo]|uniref:uncharacterized protein LOC112674967 isoform X2 n=1 Tax=Canis lupus dingo TaxID=286419 RepID=UPI0020C3F203|nr:uncharacterized protein LOC112674967 isoform X2 [Canis lupus dingo]